MDWRRGNSSRNELTIEDEFNKHEMIKLIDTVNKNKFCAKHEN